MPTTAAYEVRKHQKVDEQADTDDSKWPSTKVEHLTTEDQLHFRIELLRHRLEDIKIETLDSKILIDSRHQEINPEKTMLHHFSLEFLLPDDVDPDTVTASWAPDTQTLRIKAPRQKRELISSPQNIFDK